MSDLESPPPPSVPSVRRGWSWALTKCFFVTLFTTLGGALGMWALARWFELPWYLPKPVYDWLMENVIPIAPYIGAFLGALLGLGLSVLVILTDAMRGKLSKIP